MSSSRFACLLFGVLGAGLLSSGVTGAAPTRDQLLSADYQQGRTTFLQRSRIISLTRRWLEHRGFIEVETPVLQPIPGGALARP
ncbi:MAG: amino acid--tRNA ligase-related protein, partial [Gammaproteobacteria bacterium]